MLVDPFYTLYIRKRNENNSRLTKMISTSKQCAKFPFAGLSNVVYFDLQKGGLTCSSLVEIISYGNLVTFI